MADVVFLFQAATWCRFGAASDGWLTPAVRASYGA